MENDAVARFGYLALGTRLKRLGEQLQAGVAEVVVESGLGVQVAEMPLLVAVDEGGGRLTVADLVMAIGTSQPAVSRSLGNLERKGLVAFDADEADGRIRRPRVTEHGTAQLATMREHLFPRVAAAAERLCEGLDLLNQLATIEQRLRACSFAARIREERA